MSKKKVLDVTTKGWSKEELTNFKKSMNKVNFRWEFKAISRTGKIKWFHAYTKTDIEIFAVQSGYKILTVKRKN